MMLLYGVIRSMSAILRRYVEWMQARAERAYERTETAFQSLENSCKADEVTLGRPWDYAGQLKLLKAYEVRELAKQRWVRATERRNRSRSAEAGVRRFSEMRLPYTFGLIDMACLMRTLDHFGILPQFDQPLLEALYSFVTF